MHRLSLIFRYLFLSILFPCLMSSQLTTKFIQIFSLFHLYLSSKEFTQFVVEKANILNKRLRMTSIAHYSENNNLVDSSSAARHRHDATSMIDIAPLGLIGLVVRYPKLMYMKLLFRDPLVFLSSEYLLFFFTFFLFFSVHYSFPLSVIHFSLFIF